MKNLIAVVLCGVSLSCFAEPLRFELQAAQCWLKPTDQGGWWQGQLISAEMKADCYQLGVSQITNGFGWRAAWVDLGSYRLHEDAIGGPGVQPHWTAIGSGEVFGASLALVAERPVRRLNVSAEAGGFLYRSQWRATAFHNASSTVALVTPETAYGLTWYAGAGVSYGWLTLNARFYPGIRGNTLGENGDNVGPARANVLQVGIGLQIPLQK